MTWHRVSTLFARQGARLRIPLLAASVLAGPRPVSVAAQSITLTAKHADLRELTAQLAPQCGYQFRMGAAPELEDVRHDFSCQALPFPAVLNQISTLFHCDFFSLDSRGFTIVPAEKPSREVYVGPYRLRFSGPFLTQDDRSLQFTLMLAADTDEQMEAIAGPGPDLRVVDNFGRSMFRTGGRPIPSTSAIRPRLNEYWLRLALTRTDDRAVRIRSVKGSVILYRKVTPLRIEFPLTGSSLPAAVQQAGVTVRLDKTERTGSDCSVSARLAWPANITVLGRGISRTPLPYLVDDRGTVIRASAGTSPRSRDEQGNTLWNQRLRFEGVRGTPKALVYDLFVREDPATSLPFQVSSIVLPAPNGSHAAEGSRPYFEQSGGSISFSVRDRDGKRVEGEVSLGMARKTAAGWSATRWLKLVTDPEGRVVLGHVQPGSYRLVRQFRANPSAAPLSSREAPLEVNLAARGEAMLAPLVLTVARPAESP